MAKDDYAKKKNYNKNGSIESSQISGDNSENTTFVDSPGSSATFERNETTITYNHPRFSIKTNVYINVSNDNENQKDDATVFEDISSKESDNNSSVQNSEISDLGERGMADLHNKGHSVRWYILRKKVKVLSQQEDVNIARWLYHSIKDELSSLFENNEGA